MSGIYGNNKEDKYFEDKLLSFLEGSGTSSVTINELELSCYNVDLKVTVNDSSIVEIEVVKAFLVLGEESFEEVTNPLNDSNLVNVIDSNIDYINSLIY